MIRTKFIPRNERLENYQLIREISEAIFGSDDDTNFAEFFVPLGGRVPKPQSENFEKFLINAPTCLWAIYSGDCVVGFILIGDIPHPNSIGFSINSKYSNQGIMKKAWKQICDNPNITYPLNAYTSKRNELAKKLLGSLEFNQMKNEIDFCGESSFHYKKEKNVQIK